jgi:hypothetical protein
VSPGVNGYRVTMRILIVLMIPIAVALFLVTIKYWPNAKADPEPYDLETERQLDN